MPTHRMSTGSTARVRGTSADKCYQSQLPAHKSEMCDFLLYHDRHDQDKYMRCQVEQQRGMWDFILECVGTIDWTATKPAKWGMVRDVARRARVGPVAPTANAGARMLNQPATGLEVSTSGSGDEMSLGYRMRFVYVSFITECGCGILINFISSGRQFHW